MARLFSLLRLPIRRQGAIRETFDYASGDSRNDHATAHRSHLHGSDQCAPDFLTSSALPLLSSRRRPRTLRPVSDLPSARAPLDANLERNVRMGLEEARTTPLTIYASAICRAPPASRAARAPCKAGRFPEQDLLRLVLISSRWCQPCRTGDTRSAARAPSLGGA